MIYRHSLSRCPPGLKRSSCIPFLPAPASLLEGLSPRKNEGSETVNQTNTCLLTQSASHLRKQSLFVENMTVHLSNIRSGRGKWSETVNNYFRCGMDLYTLEFLFKIMSGFVMVFELKVSSFEPCHV